MSDFQEWGRRRVVFNLGLDPKRRQKLTGDTGRAGKFGAPPPPPGSDPDVFVQAPNTPTGNASTLPPGWAPGAGSMTYQSTDPNAPNYQPPPPKGAAAPPPGGHVVSADRREYDDGSVWTRASDGTWFGSGAGPVMTRVDGSTYQVGRFGKVIELTGPKTPTESSEAPDPELAPLATDVPDASAPTTGEPTPYEGAAPDENVPAPVPVTKFNPKERLAPKSVDGARPGWVAALLAAGAVALKFLL